MQVVVLSVQQLAFLNQLRQGQRRTGLTTADHGAVKDEGGPGQVSSLVEGALDCLDELDLAIVGLDVEGGEELIVIGVVDQFWILDDDCLVGVVVVFLEALYAVFEIADQRGRHLDPLAVIDKGGALEVAEDADHFDEDVDEFEDLSLVNLLVDLVLADVVSHVEEGDQFELQLLLFEPELNLHAFQRV